jgi:hypothetical protein
MHKQLNHDVEINDNDELWKYYFDLSGVKGSKKIEFEQFVVTDGLSAGLCMSRRREQREYIDKYAKKPSRQEKAKMDATKLKVAKAMLNKSTRVVAVDPGRNPIFTAVVHNVDAMDTLQAEYPANVKHETISWTRGRYHHEAGHTHRKNVTKLWTEKNPHIITFNAEVGTAKTRSYLGRADPPPGNPKTNLQHIRDTC